MPSISVVFVTNRKGGTNYLLEQLAKQTVKPLQIIISDDTMIYGYPTEEIYSHGLKNVTMQKPDKKKDGDVWNLNKAYNSLLYNVTGELIVFLQDFIWLPANALERFWEMHELFPDDLIAGCGHKALNGLEGISEIDERVFGEGVTEGNFSHFEMNFASAPAKYNIRFDEEMDKNYGGENHYFANQAIALGAKVLVDHENRCVGYSQEYCGGRPADWEEKHYNKLH